NFIQTALTALMEKIKSTDTFTMHCEPARYGYQITLTCSNWLNWYLTASTKELASFLEHPPRQITETYTITRKAYTKDVYVTVEDVRQYASRMGDLIAQSDTPAKVEELTQLSKHNNHILYLNSDTTMYYYFYNPNDPAFEEANMEVSRCIREKFNDPACSTVGSLLPLFNQNILKSPIKVTLLQGYYTPYTFCDMINKQLPYSHLYWFSCTNDEFNYSISVTVLKGSYIVFDEQARYILECQAFEPTLQSDNVKKFTNNHTWQLPTMSSRELEFGYPYPTRFPFKTVDLSQLKNIPKGQSPVQQFMQNMFDVENAKHIRYTNKLLRSTLSHGFHRNTKKVFYFIPGIRLKVRIKKTSSRTLHDITCAFTPGTPLLHYYSTHLSPRCDAILHIESRQEFMHILKTIPIPKGQYTIRTLIDNLEKEIKLWLPTMKFKLSVDNF
ncbi:MAG: hypothetical protein AAGK05_14475, partial [Pseudomonadota bacterium]